LTAWDALASTANAILENRAEGRSRLALIGNWQRDRDAKISQLGDEFNQIRQFPGLSGHQVAKLYQLLYSRELGRQIDTLLARASSENADPQTALKTPPLLSLAAQAANELARPTRWFVPNGQWDYADNPNQVQRIDAIELKEDIFGHLLADHPKTQALAAAERARKRLILYPTFVGQVFVWSLPTLDILRDLRSPLAIFNRLIAERYGFSLAAVESMTDEQWLANLSDVSEVDVAIDEQLALLLKTEGVRLEPKLRLAVSYQRKLLARLIREVIQKFTAKGDKTWGIPTDILGAIDRFADWVTPDKDRNAQVAALFLECGKELNEKLKGVNRFDIITGYFSHIVVALNFSEGPRLKELERIVPASELPALLANRTALLELREALDKARKKTQVRFGFRSDDGTVLKSLRYEYPIKPNLPFVVEGATYKLLKVHRKFTYNPAYGYKPAAGSEEGAGGYNPPLMDGKEYYKNYKPTGAELVTIEVDNHKYTITDRDEELLDDLTKVVEQEAFSIAMRELGAIAEASVELALDVAELIPGAGQALAGARVIATFVEFVATGEFDDIKQLLRGEPDTLIRELLEKLESLLTPDQLWEFLLFGSPLFDALKEKKPSAREHRVARKNRGKKIGAIISGVKRLKAGFAAAMQKLRERVQIPLRALQGAVLSRPRLALGLALVADHLHQLEAFASGSTDIIAGMKQEKEEFPAHLEELLVSLNELKLPEEVVPLKPAIAAIISLVLRRFGTKGKIARIVLEQTGGIDYVSELLEKELKSEGIDPNRLWTESLKPKVETKFVEARAALVSSVYNVLTTPPLALDLKRPDEKTPIEVTLEGEGFEPNPEFAVRTKPEEAEPYLADGPDPAAVAALLPPDAGRPLSPSLRRSAESRFGHDFGHIRLHDGPAAARVTEAYGAEGIATGSHVYLRPGLSPESGAGARIFNHELTHVLQQTGARPLGGRHDQSPKRGRAGRGLQIDPASEATAERLSGDVRAGGTDWPVDVGPRAQGDVQAAGLSTRVLKRFLRELGDLEKAKKAQRELDARIPAAGEAKIDASEKQIAVSIAADFWSLIDHLDAKHLPTTAPRLADVKEELKKHVKELKTEITKAVPFIAEGALVSKKREKGSKEPPPRVLNVVNFGRLFQSYVLARTGVAFTLDVKRRTPDGATPQGGWVNKPKFKITNLLLTMVGGISIMWSKAMKPFGADDNEKTRAKVRGVLHAAGTMLHVNGVNDKGDSTLVALWDPLHFQFSKALVEYVRVLEALSTAERPEDVPRHSQYTKHDDLAVAPVVGLRSGLYGDKNQAGPDRESHHTTQYLLIEYFRNQVDQKPFNDKNKRAWETVGLKWDTKTSTASFKHPTKPEIEFAALDVGDRGDAMPAILLARSTHRAGGLHITPKDQTEDFAAEGSKKVSRPTQGKAVDDRFKSFLYRGEFDALKKGGGATFDQFVGANKAKVQDHVYDAIQATYSWMVDEHMMPALEKALPALEVPYYRAIAGAKHMQHAGTPEQKLDPEWDLQSHHVEAVYTAAERKNIDVMGKRGWGKQ
jgi:hypothetical protein